VCVYGVLIAHSAVVTSIDRSLSHSLTLSAATRSSREERGGTAEEERRTEAER